LKKIVLYYQFSYNSDSKYKSVSGETVGFEATFHLTHSIKKKKKIH